MDDCCTAQKADVCLHRWYSRAGGELRVERPSRFARTQVAESTSQVAEMGSQVAETDAQLAEIRPQVAEKDPQVAEKFPYLQCFQRDLFS